ncbi:clavesin-2-like [Leptidea sinapis]|uniref:clavesin-2-like n=1 Tax=Leptidea sinapis TaxID=189913 RepID=UPI00212654DA|nr:clavesin-2-like [Leptidea sinapis]
MPVRPLEPLLAEKARVELGEDVNRIEEHIRTVKQWIAEQPHLIARTDDQWLVAFLRGCKYNINKVKKKMELFYNIRSTSPDVYCVKYNEPKIYSLLEMGICLIMPKTKIESADPRVVVYRIGQFQTSKYHMLEFLAVLLLQFQICFMEDDNVTVSGMVHVVDLLGSGLSHYTQLSLSQIRKMISISQDAAPMRMKGVHYLNNPYFFETFYRFVRNFMSEKNRKRIHVHSKNYEELYKHVPKESLPVEYGGSSGTVREIIDYWKIKMREYHSWFEEDTKYVVDESKRVKNASLKSCFKQINEID